MAGMNVAAARPQLIRGGILIGAAAAVAAAGRLTGALTPHQAIACGVFTAAILGTLFFWRFRLAVAFLGVVLLILTRTLDIPHFITSASLDVILFLVGMMVVIGALRDLGFFSWVLRLLVSIPNLTGRKFTFLTCTASALLACAVDEVTSIIFISNLIFQVRDRLKITDTPFLLMAVIATNIGSAGTMMGNPVGILIGTKAGLTFGDFIQWAFPPMLAALILTNLLMMFLFRRWLNTFDAKIRQMQSRGGELVALDRRPSWAGMALALMSVAAIASHHQLELVLELPCNSVLLIAPLACAGVTMLVKPRRARHYIETDVDWWTLLFFMFLFAMAGTLTYTHVDQLLARGFSNACGTSMGILIPVVFTLSALGSAFVDNVVFVAAFSPVVEQLSQRVQDMPLWWSLLFGACLGGNITMIGSTANIVALGMLEKRGYKITFFGWLRVGLLCTLLSGAVVTAALLLTAPLMPEHRAETPAVVQQQAER